jgi:hypothetical protein
VTSRSAATRAAWANTLPQRFAGSDDRREPALLPLARREFHGLVAPAGAAEVPLERSAQQVEIFGEREVVSRAVPNRRRSDPVIGHRADQVDRRPNPREARQQFQRFGFRAARQDQHRGHSGCGPAGVGRPGLQAPAEFSYQRAERGVEAVRKQDRFHARDVLSHASVGVGQSSSLPSWSSSSKASNEFLMFSLTTPSLG